MISTVTGKIQILPDTVSCRIAAGEVVERPASVVKELIDNSLDAGSTLITVDVEDGGRRVIRVIDNGAGMTRMDAQLACQRFATSKLRSEEDLLTLTTMGFRGEALPSIASVSRFSLKTVPPESTLGTHTQSMGGTAWEVQEYTGSQGTQVEVRDLFFNTPGRLKFLKTIPTEFSKICYVIQQAAAVHPGIHFRVRHQNHKVLEYPAVATLQNRLLQIYGPEFLDRYLPVTYNAGSFQLTGFTVSPHHARASRAPQEIFVNGRPIKNSTISHAVHEAYGSFLPKGKHPQFIVFINLDPQTVDINVHPTKREVRFSHPEFIHTGVLRSIKALFFTQPSSDTIGNDLNEKTAPVAPPLHSARTTTRSLTVAPAPFQHVSDFPGSGTTRPSPLSLFVQEPPSVYESKEQPWDVYPLGQIHHTYLIGQINEDVFIVDQHTAHERVRFERLLRSWKKKEILQQTLLIPEPVELLPHQGELLEEWQPFLTQAGLEVERFGATSYVVRAIPAMLGNISVGSLILELVDELSEWQSTDILDNTIKPILATMACQSAVQAGRSMTQQEITILLQDWAQENFPMTCPHGRRVAIRHSLE
ncbi:MAG TPA: DNA mismatch repair endonuclease MutL, partial [Nitrospirales bacterium]|nr:DNA mismatch repair endonuclease MutL [Nitrospirales bacterium]